MTVQRNKNLPKGKNLYSNVFIENDKNLKKVCRYQKQNI